MRLRQPPGCSPVTWLEWPFIGVGIADKAIQVNRAAEDRGAEWHVSTIEEFPLPPQKVEAICLCESLYYARHQAVPLLLGRCHACLSPGAVFSFV